MAQPARDELAGTGRHLTDVELFVWTRFLDTSRLIEELLNKHLVDNHAMTHSEYEILVRLDGAGDSMRVSVLAEQCVAPRPRTTQTLNRVEKRGWIRREPVEHDGRGLLVILTDPGKKALADASGEHARLVKEHLLSQFPDEQLQEIGDALAASASHLRERRKPR